MRLEALLRSADTSARQFGGDVPLPFRAWDTVELVEEYLAEAGPASWSRSFNSPLNHIHVIPNARSA